MRETFLNFSPPSIGDEEIEAVVDTLRSDWITTGPKVKRFEAEFAQFVGSDGAVAVSSCTAALHTALKTLGAAPGGAVITTAMTFCSTVNVIEHAGARPVLVDISPEDLNIDCDAVERAAAELAAAGTPAIILPVHLYGQPCRQDRLRDIAQHYGMPIVEDAAHALPARFKGELVGSKPTNQAPPVLTAFSFYATKNMTTVEGGMLTGPAGLLAEARLWAFHGISNDAHNRYRAGGSAYYEVVRPGFKYNMTDVQAAIGLAQLAKLPRFSERRQQIAALYNQGFRDIDELETPVVGADVEPAWHLYALRLNLDRLTLTRDQFADELRKRNIGSSVHFIPIHLHPYYARTYGWQPEDFPVANREYYRLVSLPLFGGMTEGDAADVIDAVRDIAIRFRKRCG